MTDYNGAAYYKAISAVQLELSGKFVTTDTVNVGKYSFQYVPLPELLNTVTPILAKVGLTAFFTLAAEPVGNVVSVKIVHGETGYFTVSDINLGAPKADFKQTGGDLTYYYRRLLMGLLGIHPEPDETEQVTGQPNMPPFPFPPQAPPQFNQQPQMQPQIQPPMPLQQYAPAPNQQPQFNQGQSPTQAPAQPPMQQPQHTASQPPQFTYARPQ